MKKTEISKKKLMETLGEKPQLIVDDAPFEYIEAFKELRTNINFIVSKDKVSGKGCKILVTSSIPGEGKSTTAINMALSLAQGNHKVLLIDADMRNPALRKYLHLEQKSEAGLSALLHNDIKLKDCLIRTEYGVDVIANGPVLLNAAELIKSDAMQGLMKGAEEHYDYIIVDTPPVGVVTDAAALSILCDGVIYVIRQAYASRKQVRQAIKKLQLVDAKILGTVMTHYENPEHSGGAYSYNRKYKYGYGK